MYIYTCKKQWEDMLTCIYEAWTSRRGHDNIKLMFEPVEQYSIFDEYIHVECDMDKARKVAEAVNNKLTQYVYNQLLYCSMAYEDDVMDVIYRVMLIGFYMASKENTMTGIKAREVLNMVQYKDIMRFNQIHTRLGKEINRFQEVIRFHQVTNNLYVSHIEPKSRIVVALGPIFQDRMPSENFIIVDDVYREAVIHPKDSECYIKRLSEDEYERLLETEEMNDGYTDLWKVFFENIAIKERENRKCQNNLFPIWARKHAVEFV